MAEARRRVRSIAAFLVLNVLPIVLGGLGSAAAIEAQLVPEHSAKLRLAALVAGSLAVILLVVKAAVEFDWVRRSTSIRHSSLVDLYNRLSSLLSLIDDMARQEQSQLRADRASWLRGVAVAAASALVSLVPENRNARASIFEVGSDGVRATLAPIGTFGRRDRPRTFTEGTESGDEVFRYLQSKDARSEIYSDVKKRAPDFYGGNLERYRTFIRAPIYTDGIVYGMVTIDAPKQGSLTDSDQEVAELVAAVLAISFSLAAN